MVVTTAQMLRLHLSDEWLADAQNYAHGLQLVGGAVTLFWFDLPIFAIMSLRTCCPWVFGCLMMFAVYKLRQRRRTTNAYARTVVTQSQTKWLRNRRYDAVDGYNGYFSVAY